MHSSGTYTLERPTEHPCFGCRLAYPIVARSLIFPRPPLQGPRTNVAAHTEMPLSSLLWTIVYQNDSLRVSNLYLLKIPISLPSNTQLHMTQLQGLTIRIPPRTHHICTLCKVDYTVPPSDGPQTRCLPCQKCEKCSRCSKIKKRKRFRKEDGTNSIFKTCNVCREKDIMRNFQKRLQALSLGACTCIHMMDRILQRIFLY